MKASGKNIFKLEGNTRRGKLIKKGIYIEEDHEQFLSMLSSVTGKDPSILVNEAISDLIKRYQPMTKIALITTERIQ